MRLFIAIPVTPPQCLRSCIEQLKNNIEGEINWVPETNMHLTIQFLGDTNQQTAEMLMQDLNGLTSDNGDRLVKISGIGFFKHHGRPSVIWAGIHPAAWITNLHNSVTAITAKYGFVASTSAYLPHITIGRIKKIINREKLVNIAGCYSFPRADTIVVTSFNLYESILRNEGAEYKTIKAYPLKR